MPGFQGLGYGVGKGWVWCLVRGQQGFYRPETLASLSEIARSSFLLSSTKQAWKCLDGPGPSLG